MPREFVTPYVDEKHPLECQSCGNPQVVGLQQKEQVLNRVKTVGFICLNCIAMMWNTPAEVPMEPSAEERAQGTPILEQKPDTE
jgi:hypothetical protein